ncbi:MAG TPA: anthranilate phosphoribosyltransferase [Trueperaceae bacterium]|nr:anthranilate phosphoribosyltransferase [Trueperaceae bacterium]
MSEAETQTAGGAGHPADGEPRRDDQRHEAEHPVEKHDIAAILGAVFDGETLSRETARDVMGRLMDGRLSQMQAAALLAALRTRGETVEEIIGFAQAMRARAVHVPARHDVPLLDTCGTGGTGIDTINISTSAMFVIAAAGVKVAKHGNVGITRKSGSADVLRALGADLDQSPERLAEAIDKVGLAFMFAKNHHPAMKFVAPIRADLKARTIFNNLGPLTNPAAASRQLMGVYDAELTERLADVLTGLGVERALVVHGDRIDDFTVTGPSKVTEVLPDGSRNTFVVTPEEVGLGRYALAELAGGDATANAAALRGVLDGTVDGAKRDVVAFNAGAALYLAGAAAAIEEGVQRALELMRDGSALAKLEQYVAYTRS